MWKQRRFGHDSAIYGLVNEPEGAGGDLVLMFAGLGQAMSEKNYFFSNLRKYLARSGTRVVQFDYRGHGDSFGELGDTTVSGMKRDALEVLAEVLAERPAERVFLIGNALGGIIALQTAAALQKKGEGAPVCIPVLLAPPFRTFPGKEVLFGVETLQALRLEGKLDAQLLVPGFDYYTLSDFNREPYDFFMAWGAHMLYLHGQCISADMLDELLELDTARLVKEYGGPLHIMCGSEDDDAKAIAEETDTVVLHGMRGYRYFYQHPAAMDQWIIRAASIVRGDNGERESL
ncbi:alpha/beta hydrolase [Paenibacillus sp. 1P03SA]|uniref:alpha/beta hydrolase n=1 Tax=Paenibacillus sp. 1P03SA TaxID=3132294 RepID=UPI00399EEC6E